jgi:hypothetical protein
MSSKIKISLEDPETRAIWNAALRARDEVASWPAWKRGEDDPPIEIETPVPPAAPTSISKSH